MEASTQTLCAALAPLVGGHARPAEDVDTVAGARPRVVIEPASEQELAAALAFADRETLKVLVRGGGTQLGLGHPPSGGDILLSTLGLDQVIEHAPHDQTVTVQAGIRLAALQAHLASTRQWLALDPVLGKGATIGGIVSTNASGPQRLRYGGVRDQILGVRVALADGTLARGGGKVVKNVAGYDLPKLFTGALGTLGVIVAATFRLYPLPAASRTVLISAPGPAPLCALVLRVLASPLVPTALDVVAPAEAEGLCRLVARFQAMTEETVADQAARLLALARELDLDGHALVDETAEQQWSTADSEVAHTGAPASGLLLKTSVLPGDVAGWLEDLAATAQRESLTARWRAHAGHGLIFTNLAGEAASLVVAVGWLRDAAVARRGSLVVLDASPPLVGGVDVWGPSPALDLLRRLKEQFDPRATLNPGRFVGGI
jgi:glycolate oxidase FAD binding subunit